MDPVRHPLRSTAVALLVIVAMASGGCVGNTASRTRTPSGTPAAPAATATAAAVTSAPTATSEATATSEPTDTSRPDPTPIIAEGLPAPALDGLASGATPFDLAALQGHPTLVFFGYTHCPDVCPATLGELVLVVDQRPDVRVVFVTVDPERDTPDFMAEWTGFMPAGFIGVSGSPTAIKTAADGYGVRYARVDSKSAAGYSMSHTAFVYLIDADGRLRLKFPFGSGWKSMVQVIDASAAPVAGGPSPSASGLSVEGAWARVSPMMQRAGAAYLVIRNSGATDDALVSVTSPAAATVELHQTAADPSSDMMAMQPVTSVPVPAGGMAELKEGGYHMMLIDLTAPLVAGATIDLVLTFQSGTVLTIPAEVRSGMPMGSAMPMGPAMPVGSMGTVCRISATCPPDSPVP